MTDQKTSSLVDVVDEEDRVIGHESLERVHDLGFRHRRVSVLVFQEASLRKLLISQKRQNGQYGGLNLQVSAQAHVMSGQSYDEAAFSALGEYLFNSQNIPLLNLKLAGKYGSVSNERDLENTTVFYTVFGGPFNPNLEGVKKIYWQDFKEVDTHSRLNPDSYAETFHKAIEVFSRRK